MKVLLVSLLSLALPSVIFPNRADAKQPSAQKSDKKKPPEPDPVVWGMLSQADGCVIFKESRKKDTKFYGIAATQKIYTVLDVIETQHYDMAQQHFIEDQAALDRLQKLAASDHVTFVKIQEGYSPALLDKARGICTNAMGPARSPDSAAPLSHE